MLDRLLVLSAAAAAAMQRPGRAVGEICGLVVLVASLGLAPALHAQDRFDAEAFHPAPLLSDSILSTYGARTLPSGAFSVGLMASYARRPLALGNPDLDEPLGDLVGSIGTLSVLGTFGLFDRVDLGLAVPIHRVTGGSDDFDAAPPPDVTRALVDSTEVGLGDVRLVPRVALVEREARRGVGLALLAPMFLPTGDDALYVGEPFRIEPRVALDYAHDRVLLAVNVGYLIRRRAELLDSQIDDLLRVSLGAEIGLSPHVGILVEGFGGLNVAADDFGEDDAPVELLAGLRYRRRGFVGQIGAGPGLAGGMTSPEWRLFAALGYTLEPEEPKPAAPRDRDGDGFVDARDTCPAEPEDADGFEDTDGCPDPDNDGDGVLDPADACPDEPEDADGFEDTDGCPDPDNDGDGVLDSADGCPGEPEDADGFEDTDGCPDPDNDGDGVLDPDDGCPDEAGLAEEGGCPESRVALSEDTIELREVLLFVTGSAEIDARSRPLLDEIAELLSAHPEVELVSVEGHTDSRGTRAYNRELSQRRAEAVIEALVERGVARARLVARGFGSDRPIAPNTDAEGRAKNRRVEFRIEQRDQ